VFGWGKKQATRREKETSRGSNRKKDLVWWILGGFKHFRIGLYGPQGAGSSEFFCFILKKYL
jgi:hypothetical protein